MEYNNIQGVEKRLNIGLESENCTSLKLLHSLHFGPNAVVLSICKLLHFMK